MQDPEILAQLEKIEMNMHRVSIMLEALVEAEGINVHLITNVTQDQLSATPSTLHTENDLDVLLPLERGDDGGDDDTN
jgi:hypothetical protein